jgi:carboxymethylenebutenolidase
VSDLERYIVEEWAEEYRQGRMNRRELLRRMAVMAGSVALAVPVLQSLGIGASSDEVAAAAAQTAPTAAPATGVTVPENDPALEVRGMITYPSDGVSVQAYLALPRRPRPAPGVVIIHENRGLTDHFKDVARRFAKAGYAGLAPDLTSHVGGTARFSDPAEVSAVLGRTPPDQLVGMANAGVRYLQGLPEVRRDRIGATGYCFGGGIVWRMATTNPDLRAAAPYYGSNPPIDDVPKIRGAVLAIYGELDERINAGIPAIREALQRANITHTIVVFPGANHAFFNDTGQRYHAPSAEIAWHRTLAWFERFLKS